MGLSTADNDIVAAVFAETQYERMLAQIKQQSPVFYSQLESQREKVIDVLKTIGMRAFATTPPGNVIAIINDLFKPVVNSSTKVELKEAMERYGIVPSKEEVSQLFAEIQYDRLMQNTDLLPEGSVVRGVFTEYAQKIKKYLEARENSTQCDDLVEALRDPSKGPFAIRWFLRQNGITPKNKYSSDLARELFAENQLRRFSEIAKSRKLTTLDEILEGHREGIRDHFQNENTIFREEGDAPIITAIERLGASLSDPSASFADIRNAIGVLGVEEI